MFKFGPSLFIQGDYSGVKFWLEKSLRGWYSRVKSSVYTTDVLYALGQVALRQGKWLSAISNFAQALQTEYEEDCGVAFGKVPLTALAKLTRVADGQEQPIGRDAAESISLARDTINRCMDAYVSGASNRITPSYSGMTPTEKLSVVSEMPMSFWPKVPYPTGGSCSGSGAGLSRGSCAAAQAGCTIASAPAASAVHAVARLGL